jgi:Na+-transporting NADH:ubiquinone oxidoreductase subunit NqrF
LIVAANRFWHVVSEPRKEENWERGVTNLIFEEMRTVFKTYIRFDHILLPPL